jgi:thioredoxin 1
MEISVLKLLGGESRSPMKWLRCAVVLALLVHFRIFANGTEGQAPASFAPFEQWKTTVLAGDKAALARLYSTHPPPRILVGKYNKAESLDDELQFWTALQSSGVTKLAPKVLSLETANNLTKLILRVRAAKADQPLFANMIQIWVQQLDGWHLAFSRRSDFLPDRTRRLPEPARPNPVLYPDPSQAQSELTTALAQAGRQKKRVLVVFGANWCYDCHVLDATFHSPAFVPLVETNYVVVHLNIGDEGRDNNDLASRLGVNLDKGIPSLAVLDPDGRVIVSQQNGEFQSSVKIGPEDVRAFLERWKPARK